MKIDPFPLKWPNGYDVTRLRQSSSFKCSMATARDGALRELKLLGAKNPVINCNMTPNNKGLLTGDGYMMNPNPGVVIYFDYKDEQKYIACDAWKTVRDNLRSIELTVKSIRDMERYKCTNIVSQALGDQRMLTAAAGKNWWEVLGIAQSESIELITKTYKALAKVYHPDNRATGDQTRFTELAEAYEKAIKAKS